MPTTPDLSEAYAPRRPLDRHMTPVPSRLAAFALGAVLLLLAAPGARAQFETKWVAAGSLHNWYSSAGSECEECLVKNQQYGFRWPGIYRNTDMQAWRGLWIGARNVQGPGGTTFPIRVVHSGPRVTGVGEVFPTQFELVTRNDLPVVTVDGNQSIPAAEMIGDRVDATIPSDVMLVSRMNTLLGVTMERRVMQFSQQFHDNYHVIEYTFTNTGNADADPEIELNQTLEGLTFFFQSRMAPTANSRYEIGNSTGWGKNTMTDTRGDGLQADPADQQFRAQYAWHGRSPEWTRAWSNIGASLQFPAINVAAGDTLGRLAASQFLGTLTLHADKSAGDKANDPRQPATTTYIGSDNAYESNNDAFNSIQMETEYNILTSGHKSPRHALAVEPSGLPGFLRPTGDPALGNSGGFSYANGYGPYTLAPGESVRIVVAEAAAGLSQEANRAIGRAFMRSGNNDNAPITYTVGGQARTMTKNEWVFTSRDSLFQTFRRATANYASNYAIPQGPRPPKTLAVRSGGDRISLQWEAYADAPSFDGWEVYRAQAAYDSTYTLVASPGVAETTYDDTTPIRGIDYYYYVVARQSGSANTGAGGTPAGKALRSSRYASQTYDPARLQRPQGASMEAIRVVPNPYYIGSSRSVRFPDQTDKLAFFNIPGICEITIYTELGELVDTIVHSDGSGDEFWDHTTSSRQVVASGIYIAVITVTEDVTDPATGNLLYSAGERTFRKFAIIR